MKTILYTILNVFLLIISISAQNGGVQIGIKHDLLNDLKDKFLPSFISKYQNVSLPNQNFEYGLLITSLHLNLTEIHLRISNFSSDNIHITTKDENLLLSLKDVKSEGNFDLKFSIFKSLEEQDKINFTLNIKECNFILTINAIESLINKGKFLPTFKLTQFSYDFDLDYQINGKIFAKLASYFKKFITSKIKTNIISEIKSIINKESSEVFNRFIENQSVYYNITSNGMGFDYSLSKAPTIENGFIILNLNGSIVDLEHKNYLHDYSIPNHEFVEQGKNIQVIISEYCLNSAIDTIQLDKIKFEFGTEDFGLNSTLRLDTSVLDLFFKDASKIYGKGENIRMECQMLKDATQKKINISINDLTLGSELICTLLIQVNDESYEEGLRFTTNLNIETELNAKEGGTVFAHLKNFDLTQIKIIESKLSADANYVEQFVNFMSPLIIPYVNKQYLNLIHVNIPSIEGLSLDDSSASLEENGIFLEVSPILSAELLKKIKIGKFIRGGITKYHERSYKTNVRLLNLK